MNSNPFEIIENYREAPRLSNVFNPFEEESSERESFLYNPFEDPNIPNNFKAEKIENQSVPAVINGKEWIKHYLIHQISSGDTLNGLALDYGVTSKSIERANDLQTTEIFFLKELVIPNYSKPCLLMPSV